tara:strand:+ start:218 stop:460 length:243 start_codon:yes stop_codon:yes gene_type:complete
MASSGPSKFSADYIIGPLFERLGKKLNLSQKSENWRAEDARKKFNKDKKKSKKKMKKGGIVKAHRGDGIAKRGRTRGRIV